VYNTDLAERATLILISDDGSHRSKHTNVIYDGVDAGNCTVGVSASIRWQSCLLLEELATNSAC